MSNIPKIAWLSPLPPQRSGVASYSYQLISELRQHLEIHLYSDENGLPAELTDRFTIYPMSQFLGRRHQYQDIVYHLGNNTGFHKGIYELAWRFPGTIVLHDYNLNGFLHDAFRRGGDGRLFEQAMIDGFGENGRKELQRLSDHEVPDPIKFPMSHAIVDRSTKVIVHHRWVRDQFKNHSHVKVIPMFAKLNCRPGPEEIDAFKKRVGLENKNFVLSCLGFINSNKLPELQIEAVRRLLDEGYPAQMVFAGSPSSEIEPLISNIKAGPFRNHFIFTGYQSETDYFSAIFAADVIINLRNPSMGEASLTLMQALAAAKPAIISNVNQYKEFPDKVCWKLNHDQDQARVLCEYLKALLGSIGLRAAISANATKYVNNVLDLGKISTQWAHTLG